MNVISPWEIYWVLQLDTIGMAAGLIAFLGIFIIPAIWAFVGTEINEAWAYVSALFVTGIWLMFVGTAIFLPSTKTAAAMFVIPKIANNESIQAEASDLYRLAKKAMERAISQDEKPKSE